MADYEIEVSIPNTGPVGPQGPPGEFGDLEAPEDGIIYGRKDADWVDIAEPANLQVRRGTAAEAASITPLEGEPVWETDTKTLVIGDNATEGGIKINNFPLFGKKPSLSAAGNIYIDSEMIQGSPYTAGGTRGSGSVDLQIAKTNNNNIASGNFSVICGGSENKASGPSSAVIGGASNVASGVRSLAFGNGSVASATNTIALGFFATADRQNMLCFGGQNVDVYSGKSQAITWILKEVTYFDETKVLKVADNVLPTIPSDTFLFGTVQVCAVEVSSFTESFTESAHFVRKFAISHFNGTVSLIGNVTTVGTDHKSDNNINCSITADNTNKSLAISVTGVAEKALFWIAVINGVETINEL
jgi:hypothetical protein